MSNVETYLAAIKQFGPHNQVTCCIEELAELQVELAKILNGKRDVKNPEHIKLLVDELADVSIMIDQMILLFNCDFDVVERKDFKIGLLKQKIHNKKDEII